MNFMPVEMGHTTQSCSVSPHYYYQQGLRYARELSLFVGRGVTTSEEKTQLFLTDPLEEG